MSREGAAALLHGLPAIPPFVVCAWAATALGFELALRRAVRLGIERPRAARLVLAVVAGGWLGSHLVAICVYRFDTWLQAPLRVLVPGGPMSSWGGLLGGVLAARLAARGSAPGGAPTWRVLLDAVAWAFPFAWMVARLGCALAHDHLGGPASGWLAARVDGALRLDLARLELVLAAGLALLSPLLRVCGVRARAGVFAGLVLGVYAVARFALEPLRVGEPRWGALAIGQWLSLVGLATAFALAGRARPPRTNGAVRALAAAAAGAWLLGRAAGGAAAGGDAPLRLVIALGYGHLLGALLRGAAASGAAPRARPRRRGERVALRVAGFATALALFQLALAASPLPAIAALALALWHVLENDLALAAGGRPPIRPRAAGPALAAALAAGAGAAAVASGALAFADALALATLYHVATWVALLAAPVAAGGAGPARRGARLRLALVHAAPLALLPGAAASGPLGAACALALHPSTYVFCAAAHGLATWRARAASPGCATPVRSRRSRCGTC